MKEQKENKQKSNRFSTILEWHPVTELPKVDDNDVSVGIIVITECSYGINVFSTHFYRHNTSLIFADHKIIAWSYAGSIFEDARNTVENCHFNQQWLEELRNNAFNL